MTGYVQVIMIMFVLVAVSLISLFQISRRVQGIFYQGIGQIRLIRLRHPPAQKTGLMIQTALEIRAFQNTLLKQLPPLIMFGQRRLG